MQPGISRASVGGILGFIGGAIIVVTLRIIFGFEPYWNLGLVLILGIFMTTYGVIWGIGGFNPEMSAHPDDSITPPTIDEMAEKAGPLGMLSSHIWLITFVSILMMVVFIAIALIPGVGLTVTNNVNASVKGLGTQTISMFGGEFPINQAWLLIGFILFTAVSLGITSGAVGLVSFWLNSEVADAKLSTPPAAGAPRENVSPLMRRAGDMAGQLAARIAPPADTETTAVIAKEDN